MKKLTKEILWLTGAMAVACIIGLLLFGKRLFNGVLLDVQVHDTYYVFPKSYFIVFIWITLVPAMYAIRFLYSYSSNRFINLAVAGFTVFVLLKVLPYYTWVQAYVKDPGFYFENAGGTMDSMSGYGILYAYITILIVLLSLVLAIAVYKTIKPFKAKE